MCVLFCFEYLYDKIVVTRNSETPCTTTHDLLLIQQGPPPSGGRQRTAAAGRYDPLSTTTASTVHPTMIDSIDRMVAQTTTLGVSRARAAITAVPAAAADVRRVNLAPPPTRKSRRLSVAFVTARRSFRVRDRPPKACDR